MFNQEPARLWAEALESGKYEQCAGALRNDDGYCCLGVACEVYIKQGGTDLRWDEERRKYLRRLHPGDEGWEDATMAEDDGSGWLANSTDELPEPVQDWLGTHESNPTLDADNETTAIYLNDDSSASFTTIAGYVREWAGVSE